MRIYIAAPYTLGNVTNNVKRVIEIAEEIIKLGHTPFVPHLFHFWHLFYPHPKNFWMKMDLVWLEQCDILLRLDGDSSGAEGEIAFAYEHGIPVIYGLEELANGS